MRVGIDARALGWAGLGRYTRNLLGNLSVLAKNDDQYVVFGPRSYGSEIGKYKRIKYVPVTSSYYSVREQTVFLASLLREKMDLMHFLHFNAPIFYRQPFVVTVHDLTRFFFPAQKNKGSFHQWAYELVFRRAIKNSAKIISVSEHTRSDLIRHFPELSEKVTVIYEGVDLNNFNKIHDTEDGEFLLNGLAIKKPYILFAGVWMTHKNLPRLLEAFRRLKHDGFSGHLVITGEGRKHDVDVPKLAKEKQVDNWVFFPGRVSDTDLKKLYNNAEVFVFPSFYEGFGLPALEALACGTPVAASRVSSIPEVLGDAAMYFDPYSVDDMAEKIKIFLNQSEIATNCIEKGLRRSELFSWKKCAEETLEVYSSILRKN